MKLTDRTRDYIRRSYSYLESHKRLTKILISLFLVFNLLAVFYLVNSQVKLTKFLAQVKERQKALAADGPVVKNSQVEFVSNELLIKLKSGAKRNIKSDARADSTGIDSLNTLNRKHGVSEIKQVVRAKKLSRRDHEIFHWYKFTLPGGREIIKEKTDARLGAFPTPDQSLSQSQRLLPQQQKSAKLRSILAEYQQDASVEDVSLNYIIRTTQVATPTPEIATQTSEVATSPAVMTSSPTGGEATPSSAVTASSSPPQVPNDPYFWSTGSWGQFYDDLWGLKKIDAKGAWDIATGSANVTVAVVDTGIDYNHPDIAANIWTNPEEIPGNNIDDDLNGFVDDVRGWDFENNDNNPMDDYGHGTHVAGTIGAIGNNGIGVVGVNWNVKIMSVKFLGSDGSGTLSNGANSIIYATDNGARIFNASWGCFCYSLMVTDAINYAHSKNVIFVASAGNSNSDASFYFPAGDSNVITVSAFDPNDQKAPFSNFGWKIDVAAPGVDILSLKSALSPMCTAGRTVGTDYCRVSGTSMAAPHVSGLAALILANRPSFTNEEVRQVLRVSADDIDLPGPDRNSGAGRINAATALAVQSVLRADITNPVSGSMLYPRVGSVAITGTAAGSNFKQYELFYGKGSSPTEWIPIGLPVLSPVENGVLGVWDIHALTNNIYVLRLVASTSSNIKFEYFTQVSVDTSRQITKNRLDQFDPRISGNLIVWTDERNGNWDVFLFDLTTNTERQITTHPALQGVWGISGNLIVWQDKRNGNWDIYLFDLTTNTERQITTNPADQSMPVISGSKIVWVDYRFDPSGDIFLFDLTTNTERQITADLGVLQDFPDISGNLIVWHEFSATTDADVYLFDLTTNTKRQITTDPADQFAPSISGNRIVWADLRNTPPPGVLACEDVFLFDLTTNTERRITPNPTCGTAPIPDISEDRIVWHDTRNGDYNIFLYDLGTGKEQQITFNPSRQFFPAISGNIIAWSDFRNFNYDIYAFEFPINTDNLPIHSGPGDQDDTPGLDKTVPNGDLLFDDVDPDDDNDLWPDTGPPTPNAFGCVGGDPKSNQDRTYDDNNNGIAGFYGPGIDPAPGDDGPSWDMDSDTWPDGVECMVGSNPADKNSIPIGTDSDFDTLPDAFELSFGCRVGSKDTDLDGLLDGWEVRWGTQCNNRDSDGDDTLTTHGTDCGEVGDVNGDGFLTQADRTIVARAIGIVIPPTRSGNFDMNKDGFLTGTDHTIIARFIAFTDPAIGGCPK